MLDNAVVIGRIAERLLIVLGAIFFAYLGYRLFVKGVDSGASRMEFKSPIANVIVSGKAPGLFFMTFGAITMIVALLHGGMTSDDTERRLVEPRVDSGAVATVSAASLTTAAAPAASTPAEPATDVASAPSRNFIMPLFASGVSIEEQHHHRVLNLQTPDLLENADVQQQLQQEKDLSAQTHQ